MAHLLSNAIGCFDILQCNAEIGLPIFCRGRGGNIPIQCRKFRPGVKQPEGTIRGEIKGKHPFAMPHLAIITICTGTLIIIGNPPNLPLLLQLSQCSIQGTVTTIQ